jgi:3-oxoadipate enol-lactonase
MPSTVANETFTTSDQTTIAFTRHPAPRPGAPRVVIIHSLGLDRHVWDEVVPLLTHEVEVLTYDCRGHGQSDRKPGRYTAESFADDLAQLLDHVGWDKAAVAGCSMGGCVALAFAGLHPNRATALGLIDTTAWYGEDAPQAFRKRAEAAREKGMRGLVGFQITRWFSDAFAASNPPEMQRAVATLPTTSTATRPAARCSAMPMPAHISLRSACRWPSSSAKRIMRRQWSWRGTSTNTYRNRRSRCSRGRGT